MCAHRDRVGHLHIGLQHLVELLKKKYDGDETEETQSKRPTTKAHRQKERMYVAASASAVATAAAVTGNGDEEQHNVWSDDAFDVNHAGAPFSPLNQEGTIDANDETETEERQVPATSSSTAILV